MSTRDYEAMFLLDNTAATEDFEGTAGKVDTILEKHGATIVQKEKWDERKLAYEIKGHRRATYYLVYFQAPPGAITEVDQDVHLTEVILRHLVIALDEPIDVHIEKRAVDREKMAEESRRASLAGWGDRKRGDSDDRGSRRDSSSEGAPAAARPAAVKAAPAAPAAATEAPAAPAAATEAPDAVKPDAVKPDAVKEEPAAPPAAKEAPADAGAKDGEKAE